MKKIIVGLLVGFMIVSQVQAMGWRDRGFNKDKMPERMCKQLELTPQQKEKFLSQGKAMNDELKKHHEEAKKHMDQVREELGKDSPNRDKIHQIIRKVEAVNTKIHIRRVDSLIDLKLMLTPTQREKFKRMGEKREHKMKKSEKKGRK